MAYQLETLGDERFQQLCQAILVHAFPNVQCLPVGQRDGGRDAFSRKRQKGVRRKSNSQIIIFQVKYVRSPESREARDLIESVVKSEKAKIDKLIQDGASAYYLLTNVAGTSFLEQGSIDKVNSTLSAAIKIESHCWWRDDLERRIEAYPSIKWSYPDILRATDLLQALMDGSVGHDSARRMSALRGYMAYQAKYDEQLKFKQIDLQKSIIDLFVDVPASVIVYNGDRRSRWVARTNTGPLDNQIVNAEIVSEDSDLLFDHEEPRQAPGALQTLANTDFVRRFPRIVVEGAPGQGKSTITQYLCLLHRLLFLNRQNDFLRAEVIHRPTEARVPFRVDVRDYALWLTGRDPFGDDPSTALPAGSNPILECFLAAQIQRYTGAHFTVDDLTAVTKSAQVLIVLDGFDEVADVAARNRIVAEVSDASARIEANALSAQVIVTSRPAAFANSPGFPSDQWPHMQILSLSNPAIQTYAEKWLEGRDVELREKRKIISELQEKLRQPHVRDLARNPMQLAILLALVSVQGASLPDKRTALYDQYINIFLNREAEKSTVVRDHRELLVQIHQYLAWVLQVDAETNAGPGHIAEGRLRDEVRNFLEQRGHPTVLVDQLFSGMIERVVALVSRVQGTYEFEVQPLREYFAARYLRDTAPYDPPGTPRRGTLLERFDAVARNFYWLNVARFLAGCYGSGELPSLLFGLEEIANSEQFKYITHIPELSVALLTDHVFNQQPKLALELASRLTQEHDLRLLLANRYGRRADGPLVLPAFPARAVLVGACKQLICAGSPPDLVLAASETLIVNCTSEEIADLWASLRPTYLRSSQWIWLGRRLGVFSSLSLSDLESLYNSNRREVTSELVSIGKFDIFENSPERWGHFLEDVLDDPESVGVVFHHKSMVSGKALQAMCIANVFWEHNYLQNSEPNDSWPIYRAVRSPIILAFIDDKVAQSPLEVSDADLIAPREFWAVLTHFLNLKVTAIKASIAPWSELIESARSIWGDRWALYRMAVHANTVTGDEGELLPLEYSLVRHDLPLCDRVAHARRARGNRDWWSSELNSTKNEKPMMRQFVLLTLFRFGTLPVILELSGVVEDLLGGLPESGWSELVEVVESSNRRATRRRREQLQFDMDSLPLSASPRLACLLIMQLNHLSGRVIYERWLSGYRGVDRAVLRAIVETTVEWAIAEQDRWKSILPEIAYAYTQNVIGGRAFFPVYGRRPNARSVPLNIARDICANPCSYPLRLVGIAEALLTKQAGEEAVPVGKIAATDEWFTVS